MKILFKLLIAVFVLAVFTYLGFSSPQKTEAHDNWRGDCYHAPNQWVSCGTQSVCSGPDDVNNMTYCFIDGSGNHSGCYTVSNEVHEANSPSCAAPPVVCPDVGWGSSPGSYCGSACVSCGVTSDRYYDSSCNCVATSTFTDPSYCTSLCPTATPSPANTPTSTSTPVPLLNATPTPTSAQSTPTPTPRPVCGDICPNDTRCRNALNSCTNCLPKSLTDRTTVCSAVPVCGKECVDNRDCLGARNGCTLCLPNATGKKVCSTAPTNTPTPTLTPAPSSTPTPTPLACNSPCDPSNSRCPVGIGQCSICVPSGNGGTCAAPTPTPSPTPAPACNSSCATNPNICQQTTDGCTFCNPATNKCSPPNTPTPSPTPFPFDESMCKCDGLDYTSIALGTTTSITAYGKVLGENKNYAKIPTFTFKFFQGSGTVVTEIKKETINSAVVEETAEKTRYKAVWPLDLPANLDTTQTYRIQAKPNCARKTAFLSNPVLNNRVVLATQDAPAQGFLARIVSFFAELFGISNNTANVSGDPTPTPTLTLEQKKQLQLKTFIPAKGVSTDNCSFIKFNF